MAYKLYTDINCDLPFDYSVENEVIVLPVVVNVEGKEYALTNDPNSKDYLDPHWFYDKLRAGVAAKTAQTNMEVFVNAFTPDLEAGLDVFYIAFSTGLSGTHDSALLARDVLKERFPDRKVIVVDSLSASLGMGLLVDLAVRMKKTGMSIEALEQYVKDMRLKVHHWFTVDDLNHLKRGGRVSSTSAFLGTMLSIKPILNVSDSGHLIAKEKQQGRKRALKGLVDHMEKCENPTKYPVFLSHGDCIDDCKLVAKMVKDRFGVDVEMINMISPIIGCHSGPGTVALFFVSDSPRG